MTSIVSDPIASADGSTPKLQLEKLCQHIQNTDRRIRQQALQTLLDHCHDERIDAIEIFDAVYLTVFRCYADRFEQSRTLAIGIVSALLRRLPANQYYADNIVPTVCRRIGQPEIVEDSEEVRLQLLQQLLDVIEKYAAPTGATSTGDIDPLLHSYNAIVDIVLKTLGDPYPTIPRTCCTVIEALARTSAASFPARADQLVQPLIALLGHRQSPTRIAAVRTLGTVALHVRTSADTIVRCIVAVSPLLMDEQAAVRLECGRVGCRWLLELRDRYSFFERLIPLALCGLHDEVADTRREIGELWRRCGRQYFDENEQELTRVELVDRMPARYPSGVDRPSLGCRAIVQRSLRVCQIVCKEMTDWKVDVRLHSLRLLWSVVLHSERALTAKFVEIAPVLVRHCVDPVKEVAEQALRVAALMGMLLKYDDWIGHAVVALREAPGLAQLRCFVAMFREADAGERVAHLREVLELVCATTLAQSMRPDIQRTLLDLLAVLLDTHATYEEPKELVDSMNHLAIDADEKPTKPIRELLYIVAVQVAAMTEADAELQPIAVQHLRTLSAGDEPFWLHGRYLSLLLFSLHDDLDTENSELAEPIVLLHGLIKLAGFQPQTLLAMTEAIQLCQQHATHAARVKILAAVSVAMLGWRRSMADVSYAPSLSALRRFVAEVVEPLLVWQAGRNAEAMRTMAVAVLRSAAEGATEEVREIFPQLAGHWAGLVEDNCVVTRAYALGCLLKCGPLPLERLKVIALAVLARLDDPSGEVRETAVKVLPLLRLAEGGEEHEADGWQTVVHHLMSTLLLHLDSPEIKLRARVADALISIGRDHRTVADRLFEELPLTFYNKDSVDAVRVGIGAR